MNKGVGVALLVAVLSGTAQAGEYRSFGTVGIGGAGVARPPAGLEGYWNPAALALDGGRSRGGAALMVEGSSRGNLIGNLKRLSDSTDHLTQATLPNGPGQAATITWIDAGMADNVGITSAFLNMGKNPEGVVRAGGGLLVGQNVGTWGFGLYASATSGVHVTTDLFNILPDMDDGTNPMTFSHLRADYGGTLRPDSRTFFGDVADGLDSGLVALGMTQAEAASYRSGVDARLTATNPLGLTPQEASETMLALAARMKNGGGLVGQNDSRITTTALLLAELPLSYGHLVDLGPYGRLGVGATIKAMYGRVYATEFRAFMTDIATAYEKLETNYRDSFNAGIDAGLLWELDRVRIGLSGRQLNSPSFRRPDAGKLEVTPAVRTGFEYRPLDWLRLAGDLDLTRSREAVRTQPTQRLGGGLELGSPDGGVRVRLGASRDIVGHSPPLLSAGVGYAGRGVTIGVDAAASTDTASYEGRTLPSDVQLEFTLGWSF